MGVKRFAAKNLFALSVFFYRPKPLVPADHFPIGVVTSLSFTFSGDSPLGPPGSRGIVPKTKRLNLKMHVIPIKQKDSICFSFYFMHEKTCQRYVTFVSKQCK